MRPGGRRPLPSDASTVRPDGGDLRAVHLTSPGRRTREAQGGPRATRRGATRRDTARHGAATPAAAVVADAKRQQRATLAQRRAARAEGGGGGAGSGRAA
eukprot:scaffold7387_cov408-Prasinococcus_capsulatus_cf.AAC.26